MFRTRSHLRVPSERLAEAPSTLLEYQTPGSEPIHRLRWWHNWVVNLLVELLVLLGLWLVVVTLWLMPR